VHAHQVLQHLTDPVAALREMLRVCRPDGVVGVRDADSPAPTVPSPTRAAGCCRGPARRARPTSWRRRRCGAGRPRPTGSGGAACGPTGSSTPPSPGRPSTGAMPTSPS
jgi:hypothetical protein